MFPFAILDPSVETTEFIKAAILPFILKLEKGLFKCQFNGDVVTFCGGLNFVLGIILISLSI